MQTIVDHAMALSMGGALAMLVKVYGKDSRIYEVTFDDTKWVITVRTTYKNAVIARFTQD